MKIVCIGGGPAGLYFALLMKQLDPTHDITVVERNKPYDTFGWGVVFSDATMDNMREWDTVTAAEIEQAFNHWDDIELLFKGRTIRSGGHGFVGIGRKHLLNILQARCEQLGVKLVFNTDAQSDEDYADADLIIASDGVNSRIRSRYENVFKPDIVTRPNRYIWLGTHKVYEAFTFDFVRTEHGWFQAHIYKFDDETSTFIVETTEETWKASGLEGADQEQSIAFCEKLFADNLDGAKMAAEIGADWLELHCAHGYLLSSFISPLTNHRTDEYGGSLENRLRYPIEIFKAICSVWPEGRPMSVRISAHDWVPGGITPEDAVEIAKAFKAAGADLIDCSSGQVSKQEKPVFGRMFQTPFADRIRQEAGIATMAVGAISEADHANSIIAAGRADLCAVARPHLANPAWTLTEAAKIGYTQLAWPKQYYQGKRQMEANFEREKAQQQAAIAAAAAHG